MLALNIDCVLQKCPEGSYRDTGVCILFARTFTQIAVFRQFFFYLEGVFLHFDGARLAVST